MVDVVSLYSHFPHGLWCQEGSDSSDNGPVEASQNDSVSHIERPVDKDHIDRCTVAFDDLDLEHRALKIFLFLKLVLKIGLTQVSNESDQIGQAFSRNCRSRYQANVRLGVLVLPV